MFIFYVAARLITLSKGTIICNGLHLKTVGLAFNAIFGSD